MIRPGLLVRHRRPRSFQASVGLRPSAEAEPPHVRTYRRQQRGAWGLWDGRWGYFFIAPALALLALVHGYPIVRVFYLSLVRYDVADDTTQWAGTVNYQALLIGDFFFVALWNTFLYTLLVVPVAIALALGLAYLIHPLSPRAQTFFKAAFYLPGVVSTVVLALVWTWLYDTDFGPLNYLLAQLGFEPVMWLGDRRIALLSVAMMTVCSGMGLPLLLLLAAIGNIPTSYYEAAEIDGASRPRQFVHITLPLLRPTLLYLTVVTTIGSFQVFDSIYLMTNGGPSRATTTLVFLIYESAFRYFDFGVASAQAVILFAIVLALALIQSRWFASDAEG